MGDPLTSALPELPDMLNDILEFARNDVRSTLASMTYVLRRNTLTSLEIGLLRCVAPTESILAALKDARTSIEVFAGTLESFREQPQREEIAKARNTALESLDRLHIALLEAKPSPPLVALGAGW